MTGAGALGHWPGRPRVFTSLRSGSSRLNRSLVRPSRSCPANEPRLQVWLPSGSPRIRSAPGTPPAAPSPASPWTGSRPRPAQAPVDADRALHPPDPGVGILLQSRPGPMRSESRPRSRSLSAGVPKASRLHGGPSPSAGLSALLWRRGASHRGVTEITCLPDLGSTWKARTEGLRWASHGREPGSASADPPAATARFLMVDVADHTPSGGSP